MTLVIPNETGYTKALDLIDAAYRQARGLKNVDPISALDRENAFFILQGMLDAWSAETLMVPAVVRESFPLCCAQSDYLMGPNGDFDTPRPTLIRMMTVNFGGVDLPVKVVGYDDYTAIRLKALTVNPPQYVWPDYGYPLCNLAFYPVPADALDITVISEKPLADLRGMMDEVAFPPAYRDAIVYNLALRLGDQSPLTVQIAANAKRQVKARNRRQTTLQVDPMLRRGRRGSYNIYSDGY